MKLLIVSPGKPHSAELVDAIRTYETRLRSALLVEWAFPAAGSKDTEGAAILKFLKQDDYVVLLDERGKEIDSPGLAAILEKKLTSGTKRLVFVIGGAFGVSDAVTERADTVISLSKLVFPHMLVRLLLVEQLYRAWSIRTGGKYHHA